MRDLAPVPPAVVRNEMQTIQELFRGSVVPTYGRIDLALCRGEGSYVWDVNGRRYLDLGGGIAVCVLGHANAEITAALIEQSRQLVHISNLYSQRAAGPVGLELAHLIGPGKVFFGNSGAEANEGLFKLARRFGHEEGRFEILTAENSFHGRTLAGIAASGQAKVKKGFGPMLLDSGTSLQRSGGGARRAFARDGCDSHRRRARGKLASSPPRRNFCWACANCATRKAAAAHGRRTMRPFPHGSFPKFSAHPGGPPGFARRGGLFARRPWRWPSRSEAAFP